VGLVIAALLAAAMSTLSSSLNSSAATSLADFYKPLTGSSRSESHYLGVARSLTALWGAVQIGVAAAAIAMQQRTVDAVLAIASFTNGPILGLFLLSAVTKRVGDSAALVSVAAGITVMTAIWTGTGISWQWYVLIGSAVTFSTGCAASIVLDRKTEVLKGE
jgi:Na+/proline symporter